MAQEAIRSWTPKKLGGVRPIDELFLFAAPTAARILPPSLAMSGPVIGDEIEARAAPKRRANPGTWH